MQMPRPAQNLDDTESPRQTHTVRVAARAWLWWRGLAKERNTSLSRLLEDIAQGKGRIEWEGESPPQRTDESERRVTTAAQEFWEAWRDYLAGRRPKK